MSSDDRPRMTIDDLLREARGSDGTGEGLSPIVR